MKRFRSLFVLIFAVMMLCCAGMTAFAQSPVDTSIPPIPGTALSGLEDQPDEPVLDPLADAVDSLPDDTQEDPAGDPEPDAAAGAEQPGEDSDMPYFIGAGAAVLLLIGVTVFCKYKGTNHF